jgi:hypothetical protein
VVVVFSKRKLAGVLNFVQNFWRGKISNFLARHSNDTEKGQETLTLGIFELEIKGKEELIEGISHFSHVTAR